MGPQAAANPGSLQAPQAPMEPQAAPNVRRVVPPPPVSYTQPPTDTRPSLPPASQARLTPLLASEALRDDLAPMQPAKHAARLWCAALGLGLVALGSLPAIGVRRGGLAEAAPACVLGGIALVTALTRVTYRQRAVAMIALGGLGAALGLLGSGPAAGIGVGGFAWGLLRTLGATLLPAALLFRAKYRAFPGARWILGAAFAAALPFVAHAVALLVVSESSLEQAGAGIAIGAVVAGLFGFMGSETTAAASYTAFGIILGLATELALEALAASPGSDPSRVVVSAAAFAAFTSIIALGMFQVLAWRFAADARRIDLHAPPPKEPKVLAESGEWSTRA